jgi:hypothetical protein
MATFAGSKSVRRNRISTSWVFRTAASSTLETQAATALPPATAYGIPAASRAAVARISRSRTFSTARIILSQDTSPKLGGVVVVGDCCESGLIGYVVLLNHPRHILHVHAERFLD